MDTCLQWIHQPSVRSTWLLIPSVTVLLGLAACMDPEPLDRSEPVALEPELLLGLAARDAEAFSRVFALGVDSSGTVYVGETGAGLRVTAFDRDGAVRWQAGGSGDGPGEFRDIGMLGVGYEQVAVVDPRLSRVTLLRAETGELLGLFPVDILNRPYLRNGNMLWLDSTRIAFGVRRPAPESTPQAPLQRDLLVKMNTGTGEIHEEAIPERPVDIMEYERRDTGGMGRYALPFTPWTLWTPNGSGGITHAWGGSDSIWVSGLDGSSRTITLGRGPRPRTREAVARAQSAVVGNLTGAIGAAAARRVALPERQPHITYLSYDAEGDRLLVGRSELADDPEYLLLREDVELCHFRLRLGGHQGWNRLARPAVAGEFLVHHAIEAGLGRTLVALFRLPPRCFSAGSGGV